MNNEGWAGVHLIQLTANKGGGAERWCQDMPARHSLIRAGTKPNCCSANQKPPFNHVSKCMANGRESSCPNPKSKDNDFPHVIGCGAQHYLWLIGLVMLYPISCLWQSALVTPARVWPGLVPSCVLILFLVHSDNDDQNMQQYFCQQNILIQEEQGKNV